MARELALVMELPFIPIAAVLLGGGLGYLIDTRLHTFPLCAAALGLVGFLAGMREVLRRLANQEKNNGR